MKVKILEVALRGLPSGKSPATALEEQINELLSQDPELQLVSTHMSTLVTPAEPNAMPWTENHHHHILHACSITTTERRIPLYAHTEAHLPDHPPTGQTGLVPSPIGRECRPAKAAAGRLERT